MEIRENNKVCIIAPLSEKIDKTICKKIFSRIQAEKRKVAIDLEYIQDFTIDFIESLRQCENRDLGLFNIPSELLVLLNNMNIDKSVRLYVSELDFEENTRQLINRKFAII